MICSALSLSCQTDWPSVLTPNALYGPHHTMSSLLTQDWFQITLFQLSYPKLPQGWKYRWLLAVPNIHYLFLCLPSLVDLLEGSAWSFVEPWKVALFPLLGFCYRYYCPLYLVAANLEAFFLLWYQLVMSEDNELIQGATSNISFISSGKHWTHIDKH